MSGGLPRPAGLFETHLTVADLDRSRAFWRDVVGLELALDLPERGAAFLWIGGPGEAMLGLWSLGSAPVGMTQHLALSTSLDAVLDAPRALRDAGVTPLSFFGEETGEPSVIGWMPAAAVYFRDPDGHLVEYLAMLPEPARPEAGIVGWSEWEPVPLRIEPFTGDRAELRALFAAADDSQQRIDATIGDGEVLVAVQDGQLLGHVQLVGDEIASLAVGAAHRRRGLGRALVQAAVAAARERGASTVRVATAAADTGNLRFYQRCGFRLRSVQRDAFTPARGYPDGTLADGVPLRDRVWLDLDAPPGR